MSESQVERDEALMLRVQAGETACFAELARRYRPALLRVARGRMGSFDWAEDAVQEALMAAFKGRHGFDARRSFRAWLWTIQLNVCTQLWRAGHRLPRLAPPLAAWGDEAERNALEPPDSPGREPAPYAALVAEERAASLEALLARLSSAQADALRLRFFGQLKFQEIAIAQRCSLLTAKNRVKWGLLRLAELARAAGIEVDHDSL